MAAGAGDLQVFEPVMDAVARWVRLWQIALSARNELAVSSPKEVARMAATLGIAPRDTGRDVGERPGPTLLLQQMMLALGVAPDAPGLIDHAVMDELSRLCASCKHQRACADDLAAGTAAVNFYRYCPNARALDSICVEVTSNRL